MKDKDIIKALECCNVETDCKRCPLYKERSANCIDIACKNALDLITRQQAEIENLKIFRGYAEKRASDYRAMRDKYLNAKSEAVKEFVNKLKENSEIVHLFSVHTGDHYMVDIDDIDNLVKEMVGENND